MNLPPAPSNPLAIVPACKPMAIGVAIIVVNSPTCVKPSDLSGINIVHAPDGVHRMEEGAIVVVRMPVGARRLHIRAPRSEALAPNLSGETRIRCRVACRPWRRRRSDTKNEIGLQEGRFSAPQADASSHSKHGSDTDSQGGGL